MARLLGWQRRREAWQGAGSQRCKQGLWQPLRCVLSRLAGKPAGSGRAHERRGRGRATAVEGRRVAS
jgi:hypothetical protein